MSSTWSENTTLREAHVAYLLHIQVPLRKWLQILAFPTFLGHSLALILKFCRSLFPVFYHPISSKKAFAISLTLHILVVQSLSLVRLL